MPLNNNETAVTMIMSRILPVLFFFVCACAQSDAALFSYRETKHKDTVSVSDYRIIRKDSGYAITIGYVRNGAETTDEMTSSNDFSILTWRHHAGKYADFSLVRQNDRIDINGTLSGKPLKKTLTIDNSPWYQIIPLGMQRAAIDTVGKSKFWAISIDKPFFLKQVCFNLSSISDTILPIDKDVSCLCMQVRIPVIYGIWKGEYFIRKYDNSFIYYQGFMYGSKRPSDIIEYVKK
jgi:hypothetical protein